MKDPFNKIEAYIKKELSAEEMRDFEKEMQRDEALAAEVRLQRLEWEAVHIMQRDQLKAKIADWQKEKPFVFEPEELLEEETKVIPLNESKKRSWMRPLAIAASILLIIGIGTRNYLMNNYSNESLFASVKNTPQLSANYKSSDSNSETNTTIQEAAIAFEQMQYDRTISLLESISTDQAIFNRARLSLGHTYFMKAQTNNDMASYQKALGYYNEIITKESNTFMRQEAEWYRILTLLKFDKSGAPFTAELESIASNVNHRYSIQAKQLLKKVNTRWYKMLN